MKRIKEKNGFIISDDGRYIFKLADISNIIVSTLPEYRLIENCWTEEKNRKYYIINIITSNGKEDCRFFEVKGLDKSQEQIDINKDSLIKELLGLLGNKKAFEK